MNVSSQTINWRTALFGAGILAVSGAAGAIPWTSLDFGTEGSLAAHTYSTGPYEADQEAEAIADRFDRKTSVGRIRGETTDVYYYADLAAGSLGAFSSSVSAFCPEDECGVPNWTLYDARSNAWVRMKDTLTFSMPAGSYPAGVDVALHGYVSGYVGSQGDTGAAASAHYYLHFTNRVGPGGQTIDSGCVRVEAGDAEVIYQPYSIGFTLVQPDTQFTEVQSFDTSVEFRLGFSCPVGTQGRSAAQQGIGNAWMIPGLRIEALTISDERVEWSSSSGVFLNHQPEDSDGDEVPDTVDNCTAISNQDQRDTNDDGFGNACDADMNGDCAVNFGDLAEIKAVFFSNDPDADFNGDGMVNFSDLGIMKGGFFLPPGPSGLPTACD